MEYNFPYGKDFVKTSVLKDLKKEQPDYNYLRELFKHIRKELGVKVDSNAAKKLPYVPTEEENDAPRSRATRYLKKF